MTTKVNGMGFLNRIGEQQRAGQLMQANNDAGALLGKINQIGSVDSNDVQTAANVVSEVLAARPPWNASGLEKFTWQRNLDGAQNIYNRVAATYTQQTGQPAQPNAVPQQPLANNGANPGQLAAEVAIGAAAGFAMLRGFERNDRGFERRPMGYGQPQIYREARAEQTAERRLEQRIEQRTTRPFEAPVRNNGWHKR
jgi:hypothetical protein